MGRHSRLPLDSCGGQAGGRRGSAGSRRAGSRQWTAGRHTAGGHGIMAAAIWKVREKGKRECTTANAFMLAWDPCDYLLTPQCGSACG